MNAECSGPSGKHYIYTLADPRSNAIRYVGYSKYHPDDRLKWHIKEARLGGKSHRCRWIRQLLRLKLKPITAIVEITDDPWAREIY